MLLRRLQRICAHYGAQPQFICCSATVKNPVELVQRLTGTPEEQLHLIERDGAARVRRHIHFWEPPAVGEDQRRAVDGEAVKITMRAVSEGKQVITFARARQEVEQLLARSQSAAKRAKEDPSLYSAYRGGYTRVDRERIERALRTRTIRGLFATTALEMGIDIGSLEMSVLTGFPGSRMSFWQQAGRAGRQHDDAHVVLIGGPNPMDAYYLAHPEILLYGPAEEAIVDLDNPSIATGHLRCMAREWPIQDRELPNFPKETRAVFELLKQAGTLVEQVRPTGAIEYVYSGSDLPHSKVSLRTIGSDNYEIICLGRPEPLGTIAPPQLYREAHEGALYYYLGEDYRVKTIDHVGKQVHVVPEPVRISPRTREPEGKRTTRAKIGVTILTQQPFESIPIGTTRVTAQCQYGTVQVVEAVESYKELWLHNLEKIGEFTFPVALENAPLVTKGLWIDIASDVQTALFYNDDFDLDPKDNALRVALHGLEHLLLGLVPTVALCDRRDLGSQFAELFGGQTSVARIYIYDPVPGGIGYAERAYRNIYQLLRRAYEVVTRCSCQAGCPYCVHAGWCYQENQHLDKKATILLLKYLLEMQAIPLLVPHP
jgi:DEAD/DEAH box helicase domain-containing protein